jgi:hypothetical protein
MMSPLSMRLTVPTKILSPRDMKSLSSISRSASRIFCRMTCLAAMAPMRPIGTDSTGSSMYSSTSMSGICSWASNSRISCIGQLQAGLVGHHVPAPEGLVVAGVAVHRHADVHLALVELLGRLGQRQPRRHANTTSRSTFFSREMASTNINISRFMSLHSPAIQFAPTPQLASLEIHQSAPAPPLKFTTRQRASHLVEKPSACNGAGARLALTRWPGLTTGSSRQTICQRRLDRTRSSVPRNFLRLAATCPLRRWRPSAPSA